MTRRSTRLQALDQRLSDRDRALVTQVVRLRFLSAGQLERLCFDAIPEPVTRARRTRRQLARLVELELLWRLERRVGGVRAGSTGYVYGATAEARRLDAWRRGEPLSPRPSRSRAGRLLRRAQPGLQRAVRAAHRSRAGRTASSCWSTRPSRTAGGASSAPMGGQRHLRPDAFVRLGVGEWEQLAFVEIDRGSEGQRRAGPQVGGLRRLLAQRRRAAPARRLPQGRLAGHDSDRRVRPLRREIALPAGRRASHLRRGDVRRGAGRAARRGGAIVSGSGRSPSGGPAAALRRSAPLGPDRGRQPERCWRPSPTPASMRW